MKIKILLLGFLISGCNPYSGKFACKPAAGLYCKSLSKVDEMISNGSIDYLDIDLKKQKKVKIK